MCKKRENKVLLWLGEQKCKRAGVGKPAVIFLSISRFCYCTQIVVSVCEMGTVSPFPTMGPNVLCSQAASLHSTMAILPSSHYPNKNNIKYRQI